MDRLSLRGGVYSAAHFSTGASAKGLGRLRRGMTRRGERGRKSKSLEHLMYSISDTCVGEQFRGKAKMKKQTHLWKREKRTPFRLKKGSGPIGKCTLLRPLSEWCPDWSGALFGLIESVPSVTGPPMLRDLLPGFAEQPAHGYFQALGNGGDLIIH